MMEVLMDRLMLFHPNLADREVAFLQTLISCALRTKSATAIKQSCNRLEHIFCLRGRSTTGVIQLSFRCSSTVRSCRALSTFRHSTSPALLPLHRRKTPRLSSQISPNPTPLLSSAPSSFLYLVDILIQNYCRCANCLHSFR